MRSSWAKTRHWRKLALMVALVITASTAPARADPLADSCGLIGALHERGSQGGLDHLETLARHWQQADRAKLRPLMGPVLGNFSYSGGKVFRIALLPEAVEEHLIALYRPDGAPVYVRILYVWNDDALSFINIKMQSQYYEIIQTPMMQAPQALACP